MTDPCATADEAIRRSAAILPSLHGSALNLMRHRKPSPVAIYLTLVRGAPIVDLRSDAALPFRTRFNGFYGVRRNAAWRTHFYAQFEEMKAKSLAPAELFNGRLRSLHAATGRVEASFVSKAVATLHPSSPVIDKVLRDRFADLVPAPKFGGGLEQALTYYDWLSAVMSGLAATPEASAWFTTFDRVFAEEGGAEVHPIKKLDFLIWAGRSFPA